MKVVLIDIFESIYKATVSNIEKSLGKGSGWSINSVTEHNPNFTKYNSLAGSSYVKLSTELDHPKQV